MQNRQKYLTLGFAAVMGIFALKSIVFPWYFGPINDLKSQLDVAESGLRTQENAQLVLFKATQSMGEWKARSLPPDPQAGKNARPNADNAQRLYQEWLTDLAVASGFKLRDPGVTPGIIRPNRDVYLSVQVTIDADAKYDEIVKFLYHFENSHLLHRVASLRADSDEHRGNPSVHVTIVAEGIVMQKAPLRSDLFPKTELAEAVDDKATTIAVKSADGFPREGGFRVTIGEELMAVTNVKDNVFTVTRGKNKTPRSAHEAAAPVDMWVRNAIVDGSLPDVPDEEYVRFAKENPFVVPPPKREYRPQIENISDKFVYPGNSLVFTVRATGLDPTYGRAKYELEGELPQGLKIDEGSGRVIWEPAVDAELKSYRALAKVTQPDGGDALTRSFRVTLEKPKQPPILKGVDPLTVYRGQTLSYVVEADDPDGSSKDLSFELKDAPKGAAIEADGKLTWTPDFSIDEGEHEVEVVVKDGDDQTDTRKITVTVSEDIARYTKYVGAMINDDTREAWFFDQWNNQEIVVAEGEPINVANVKGHVLSVERGFVLIMNGEGIYRSEIGKMLRDMTKMPAPKPAKQPSTADGPAIAEHPEA